MILKSQLEKIILEEAEKVLSERMVLRAISHHLTEEQIRNIRETGEVPEELIEGLMDSIRKMGAPIAFTLAMLQSAGAMADMKDDFTSAYKGQEVQAAMTADPKIDNAFEEMRDQLADEFASDQAAADYARFHAASGAPGFDTDEEAMDYYKKTLGPKYIEAVKNTDVKSTVGDRDTMPDNVLKHFTDNPGVGGLYDAATDTIYVNPHSFAKTGEISDRKIFEMALEELIHAATEDMELGEVLPGLAGEPYAGLKGAAGKIFSRIQGDVEGALAPDWQDHIDATGSDAMAGELYAKLRAVKSELKAKHEASQESGGDFPNFFDSSGKIDTEKLKDLINNPDKYDLYITPGILKTLNPDSPNLGTAFDILARAGRAADNRAMA